MQKHPVKVHPSKALLPREEQLAWKIAGVAADRVPVQKDVAEMIINRIIDNASVAIAAVNRRPVVSARAMALGHPRKGGATVFGVPANKRFSPEWAAWANGTAVRELDMHDTFLAADYSHPGDNIPPILAVAQTAERSGKDLQVEYEGILLGAQPFPDARGLGGLVGLDFRPTASDGAGRLYSSEDQLEGARAFAEKRAPIWKAC